jgi:hypothetical protein
MTTTETDVYDGLPDEVTAQLREQFATWWAAAPGLPDCPGCGRQHDRTLACRSCYKRLPAQTRHALAATKDDPGGVLGAVARVEAITWLEQHPAVTP